MTSAERECSFRAFFKPKVVAQNYCSNKHVIKIKISKPLCYIYTDLYVLSKIPATAAKHFTLYRPRREFIHLFILQWVIHNRFVTRIRSDVPIPLLIFASVQCVQHNIALRKPLWGFQDGVSSSLRSTRWSRSYRSSKPSVDGNKPTRQRLLSCSRYCGSTCSDRQWLVCRINRFAAVGVEKCTFVNTYHSRVRTHAL